MTRITKDSFLAILAVIAALCWQGASLRAEQKQEPAESTSARLLAQDFVTITEAPRQSNRWVEAPGIVTLPSGNLMATVQIVDRGNMKKGWVTRILRSADKGKTWDLLCEKPWFEVSPMVVQDKLYMFVLPTWHNWMGDRVSIVQSTDEGKTWTEPVTLIEGAYWTIPMGKAVKDNTCYVGINVGSWGGSAMNGVAVLAGDLTKGLMDPKSWRLSNTVNRPATPEGLTTGIGKKKRWHWEKDGWLEANVVNVNGRLRVLSRCVIDGYATANIGGICDLEDDGKELKLSFSQYAAIPGGQCKFYIDSDPVSKMFWMASNIPTDSQEMVHDWDKLRAGGRFNGGPGNERRILLLYYSIDALNWFPAGPIAKGENMLQSFMYPTFDFQGDDIVLISRSSRTGRNQHDADTATFHRITKFRSLALDLFPR